MTLPIPAVRAMRARFGDDADPIMTLRAAHKTVRPFGDQYSVDEVVVDSAELHRMAAVEIARREAKAKRTKRKTASGNPPLGKSAGTTDRADGPGSALAEHSNAAPAECVDLIDVPLRASPQTEAQAPSVTPVPDAGELGAGTVPAVLCPCGRAKAHYGRCWHRRGMPGPLEPVARRERSVANCTACGGPRSRWSQNICRDCYRALTKGPGSAPKAARNVWAELDELKSVVERMRVQLAMDIGR